MAAKQDKTFTRNASDLERKYDLGKSFSEVRQGIKVANAAAQDAKRTAVDAGEEAKKARSEVLQLSDSITLTVEDGEPGHTAMIKLKVGDKEITGKIDLQGLVTFTNLRTSGATEINGDNITTGTILADLIKAGVIRSKDGALAIDLDRGRFDIINTSGKVVLSIAPSNDGGYLWLIASGGESLLESGTFVDGTAFFSLGSVARSGAGMMYDPTEDKGAVYADTGLIYNPPTEPSHIVNKEYADALIDSLTASDVGAAPAGYGLGEYATRINADNGNVTDLIDALVASWPKLSAGFVGYGDSASGTTAYGNALIQKITSDYIIVQATWSNGAQMILRKHAGTWSEREWRNPPMVSGVEYRTTERWNGKVVYTKLVDLGTLPTASTQKTVTAGIAATEIADFRIILTQTSSGSVSVFPANDFYTGAAKLTGYFDTTYGMFYFYTLADMSGYTGKAAIKYTKD